MPVRKGKSGKLSIDRAFDQMDRELAKLDRVFGSMDRVFGHTNRPGFTATVEDGGGRHETNARGEPVEELPVEPQTFSANGWVLPDGRWFNVEFGEHMRWALRFGYRDYGALIMVQPCPEVFDHLAMGAADAARRWRGRMVFEWSTAPTQKQIDTVFDLCKMQSREQDWQRFRKAVDAGQRGAR